MCMAAAKMLGWATSQGSADGASHEYHESVVSAATVSTEAAGSASISLAGGEHVPGHAERIGLGSRSYQLVEVGT